MSDPDKTGTVRDLLQHWETIAQARWRAVESPTDDPGRKEWLTGYAQALDTARIELAEALDAQPSDVTALCVELRQRLHSHDVQLDDSRKAVYEALHLLGER